jgi:hypothetical protein
MEKEVGLQIEYSRTLSVISLLLSAGPYFSFIGSNQSRSASPRRLMLKTTER